MQKSIEPYENTEQIKTNPVEETASVSPRVIKSALIFATVGTALYGAATLASDRETIFKSLMGFPIGQLALVCCLVLIGWMLRGWRFHYYLRTMNEPVPLGYSIAAFLAGFALTGTPGKLGEAVKGVFLKQDYGVPVTRVVGIVMVERLMDLWGVLILGSLSLMMFSGWRGLFLLSAAVVVAGGAFLCMERLYRPVLEKLAGISFLSWICHKALGILLAGKELMTPRVFVSGLVVSTVAWGMESLSLYLVLQGLHLDATVLQANFVYCFSTLVGALCMLPGGIGGTEAGMIGLLSFLGISYTAGLPAVILIRVCTLWLAIAVGLAFMVRMLARSGKSNIPKPETCSDPSVFSVPKAP